MKILLDFGAIKRGGGAQLAVTFLKYLQQNALRGHEYAILVPESGPLAGVKHHEDCLERLVSPLSYVRRLQFEVGQLQRFMKNAGIEAIYTFFGAGLPHPPWIRSVVSMAYPVICYPESPYWRNAGLKERCQVEALNCVRRHRLRQATTIIVETEVMKERVRKVLGLPAERFRVIAPSVSTHVNDLNRDSEGPVRRYAFVSGNETHKNLWRLYEIAVRARARGFADFAFHLTVTRESYIRQLDMGKVDQEIVDSHFVFLGTVPPHQIMSVYETVDCVTSLSDLESFSNNYMEAWRVGLPLLASDRDFARAICGESALYVDPHNADSVVSGMRQLYGDSALCRKLVKTGRAKLAALPTWQERTSLVMAELEGFSTAEARACGGGAYAKR